MTLVARFTGLPRQFMAMYDLAEDGASDERNAVGPVAELTHHILVVGDDLPGKRGPAKLLRCRSQRGSPGGNQSGVGHRLQLVNLRLRR